jgi:hypothetical protein
MNKATLVLFFILSQIASGQQVIQDKDLPLSPMKLGQVVVTDSLEFDLLPWTKDKTFDPNKEMPYVVTSPDGKQTMGWETTPADYIVTDDEMLTILEPKAHDVIYHSVRILRYRKKHPWAMVDQVIVLSYDNNVFCICFGDYPSDTPACWSHANLEMSDRGKTELDVSQDESGTGAYNSLAVFEFSTEGPKLVRISQGGRDH